MILKLSPQDEYQAGCNRSDTTSVCKLKHVSSIEDRAESRESKSLNVLPERG